MLVIELLMTPIPGAHVAVVVASPQHGLPVRDEPDDLIVLVLNEAS